MSLETVVGSAAWYVRSGEWEAEKSRPSLKCADELANDVGEIRKGERVVA
jgi:hypothetical protein